MLIKSVMIRPHTGDFRSLGINTSRGTIDCRYFSVPGATATVLWLGGAAGGWDSPVRELYRRIGETLLCSGISSLHVRYRRPEILSEALLDALTALDFLEEEGVEAAGLVGHAMGGAVAIQAAEARDCVRTVVTLATQSFGAEKISELAPRCSILLVHGEEDRVLPPYCSQWAYFLAGGLKRLVLYPGAGHDLVEVSGSLESLLCEWLRTRLSP